MIEYIKKILRSLKSFLNSDRGFNIDDNEKIRLMNSYIYFVIIHVILVIYEYYLISYHPEKYPYLLNIGIRNLIILSLLISSVSGILFFKRTNRIQVVKHKKIDGIPYYVKGVDYFHDLLPLCIIVTSLLFFSLFPFDLKWVIYGALLFIFGLVLFLILSIFENKICYNLYYTVNISNYIFEDINDGKRNYLYIKKFNEYFKYTLNNIDSIVGPNLKIDCLKQNENASVKYVLSKYLQIYVQYGSNKQLDSLMTNLNEMKSYVDKNGNITSLEIISIIDKLYIDMLRFFEEYGLNINKKRSYYSYFSWIYATILIVILLSFYLIVSYTADLSAFLDSLPSSTWLIAAATIISAIIIAISTIISTMIQK